MCANYLPATERQGVTRPVYGMRLHLIACPVSDRQQTRTHTHTHTHTHTYFTLTHAHTHTHTHTHTHYFDTHTHAHTRTHRLAHMQAHLSPRLGLLVFPFSLKLVL